MEKKICICYHIKAIIWLSEELECSAWVKWTTFTFLHPLWSLKAPVLKLEHYLKIYLLWSGKRMWGWVNENRAFIIWVNSLFYSSLHLVQDITIFQFIAENIPVIQLWMWATVICRGSGVSIGIIRSYWPQCSPITSLVLEEDSLSRKPLRPQRVCVREDVTGSTAEMFHHCQHTLLFPAWQTLDHSRNMSCCHLQLWLKEIQCLCAVCLWHPY